MVGFTTGSVSSIIVVPYAIVGDVAFLVGAEFRMAVGTALVDAVGICEL